uniref:Putative AMP-dependent synthetase and ligase n=1 Tax=Moniliophthora roreri TaxID=221103 RepID=A0A0W0G3A5_MONRR
MSFQPTLESLPPKNVQLRLRSPPNLPVYRHVLNPLGFLLRAALIHPDKLALAHPDTPHPVHYTYAVWYAFQITYTHTYANLRRTQRVQNLAYALIKAGIKPGDRVAVIAPNTPMVADALQGVIAARAIVTCINTRLKHHEVAYILEHSESKLILVDHEYLHLIEGSNIPYIVSKDTGRPGDPYEEFLSGGRRFSGEEGWPGLDPEPDEDAGAVLCYTSGTTGRPKGVITTLRGSYLAASANAFETRMSPQSTILPMFHAAGWTFPWAITFSFASQITMRTVDYPKIWNHFLHSNVTHYCGAPTVQIGIVNDPAARKPPNSIRAVVAGAAPTAHLIGSLEKIGIEPLTYHFLTYGPFTKNYEQPSWAKLSLEERSKFIARQGHVHVTADIVRVVYRPEDDAEGSDELVDVPWDGKTMGEIVTRGNIVMKEYFKDPEATRKAFQGGFFHSGDLAVMHPDGSIAVLDRSKDIIISGGENASSLAIEQELAAHPNVLEVSVVARLHPKWGERPMAFVILHPQHAAKWAGKHKEFEQDLIKYAKMRLPGFACPEWVEVVPELPKTSTGKILKTELRKIVAKL